MCDSQEVNHSHWVTLDFDPIQDLLQGVAEFLRLEGYEATVTHGQVRITYVQGRQKIRNKRCFVHIDEGYFVFEGAGESYPIGMSPAFCLDRKVPMNEPDSLIRVLEWVRTEVPRDYRRPNPPSPR